MLPFDLPARLLNHKIQTLCACCIFRQGQFIPCSNVDMQSGFLLAHVKEIF